MKRIRSLWAHIAPWIGVAALGIWLLIVTPLTWIAAYHSRGYNAVGGEALMPLVPLIVWTMISSTKELFREDDE